MGNVANAMPTRRTDRRSWWLVTRACSTARIAAHVAPAIMYAPRSQSRDPPSTKINVPCGETENRPSVEGIASAASASDTATAAMAPISGAPAQERRRGYSRTKMMKAPESSVEVAASSAMANRAIDAVAPSPSVAVTPTIPRRTRTTANARTTAPRRSSARSVAARPTRTRRLNTASAQYGTIVVAVGLSGTVPTPCSNRNDRGTYPIDERVN